MDKSFFNIEQKRIEKALSDISAKIADATDLSRQAKEMTSSSEAILINAIKEIEVLYVSLGDEDING